jgi:hypothetical protein
MTRTTNFLLVLTLALTAFSKPVETPKLKMSAADVAEFIGGVIYGILSE